MNLIFSESRIFHTHTWSSGGKLATTVYLCFFYTRLQNFHGYPRLFFGDLHSKFCFSLNRFETEVGIQEACLSQMIVYDPQKDLLPLVLANCSYSLKAGQGTTIEYKFASLERQIGERFIKGKPRLNSRKVTVLQL